MTGSIPPFVGRTSELRLLDQLAEQERASLLILYGRRRVGKTRLLTHWLKTTKRRALYWVAEPTSSLDQLRSFSQALFALATPTTHAGYAPSSDQGFTYASWQQAFQQLAILAEREPLALFLDEFTYLLEAEPGLAAILQNAWDHLLSKTRIFLALSGSHLGMMQRHALSYQAPLFGRATAQLRLLPLPFGITRSWFPEYSAPERVALYALLGGIPAYWERVDSSLSLSDNIRRMLLVPSSPMHSEPRLLLQDFVTEPHHYVALLRAIAGGSRTQNELVVRTGLPQGHVSKYLSVLREAGFVERRVPVTSSDTSRLGRYHIVDPYLRFYYRFLSTRQAQLALGVHEQALEEINSHLLAFIGTHTWEELCREWVLRAGAQGIMPLSDQVGSFWSKSAQLDVVGLNSMEKTLILGECKWSPQEQDARVLESLFARTQEAVPKHGQWSVIYIGFARGGWTADARSLPAPIPPSGASWKVEGLHRVDLARLDTDLASWT